MRASKRSMTRPEASQFGFLKWLFVTKLAFNANKLAVPSLPLKPGLG